MIRKLSVSFLLIITALIFNASLGLSDKFLSRFDASIPSEPSAPEDCYADSTISGLYLDSLKEREYISHGLEFERSLGPVGDFQRYLASYQSDGFKIYGLLTLPNGHENEKFPAVILLHGYIPPDVYSTEYSYEEIQNSLAAQGFVTFKPDLRGHGRSEGEIGGAHFSTEYIIDAIHAIRAIEKQPEVDPERIGLWGHSSGAMIGLRLIVLPEPIQASVFWSGSVGSAQTLFESYLRRIEFSALIKELMNGGLVADFSSVMDIDVQAAVSVIKAFGNPHENPQCWGLIDPYNYLGQIRGPIQLHHGGADQSVLPIHSRELRENLLLNGKEVELFEYPQSGHNLSGDDFNKAVERTIEFFKENL